MNADYMSYSKQIQYFLMDRDEDYVFGLNDLAHLASYDAIRQTLKRMAEKEQIQRLFIGIYWVRRSGREYPLIEDVKEAVARNNHWVVAPGTELARMEFSLNTEVPSVPRYLSTGPSSKYTYCKTQHIFFQRCAGKFLAFAHPITTLVISALMDQETYPITPDELLYLSTQLSEEDKATIMKDRAYIPARLRPIIEVICR